MKAGLRYLLLATTTLASWSCADQAPEWVLEPEQDVPVAREARVGPVTTDGTIAQANLDAQIDGLRSAAARSFAGPDVEGALIDALLVRAQFFGTWADFDEALERSDAMLRQQPDNMAAIERRARSLSAVHRFSDARGLLEGAPTTPTALLLIDEATGGSRDALLQQRRDALEREGRSFETLTALARALALTGRFEEADAAYVEAAEGYKDVSPFPIAWVAFSRGVMWSEVAGYPEVGRRLYEEAVDRLPGYVVANVHLAELEAEGGQRSRAEARLAALPRSDRADPEPDAVLGELAEDPDALSRAHRGYEAALERYPEAVWDHGAEFFLSGGDDPMRGDTLAQMNLELRRTERAYLLAIRGAMAVGDSARADSLSTSVERPIHTAELRELVAELGS